MKSLVFLLLVSCLVSCTKSTPWQYTTIYTGNKEFDGSRLTYPATNFYHELEIEFLYHNDYLEMYINAFSQDITPYDKDPNLALVKLEVPGNKYEFIADRLRGGQRLRVPKDSTALVVELFEKHSQVTFIVKPHYRVKVRTAGFKKYFKSLRQKPLPIYTNKPVGIAL